MSLLGPGPWPHPLGLEPLGQAKALEGALASAKALARAPWALEIPSLLALKIYKIQTPSPLAKALARAP